MKKILFTIILILGVGISSCNKLGLDWLIYADYAPSWYSPYNSNKVVFVNGRTGCYYGYYGWDQYSRLYVNSYAQPYGYGFGPYYSNLLQTRGYLVFRNTSYGLEYCNE